MTKLSEAAKTLIKDTPPGFIASFRASGRTNLSLKGSLRMLDEEHIVFADIHSPNTIAQLVEHPLDAAMVFEPTTRHGCRVWGSAKILSSGELFDQSNA